MALLDIHNGVGYCVKKCQPCFRITESDPPSKCVSLANETK